MSRSLLVTRHQQNKLQTIFAVSCSPARRVEVPYYTVGAKFASYESFTSNNLSHTPVSLLKWHLACTMGAPQTFENRRHHTVAVVPLSVVTDDDTGVVSASARPGGMVAEHSPNQTCPHRRTFPICTWLHCCPVVGICSEHGAPQQG